MVGVMKPRQIKDLISLMMGLAKKDARKVAETLVNMSGITLFKEMEDLEFSIQHVMDKYTCIDCTDVKISAVTNECLQLLVKFKITVPSNIFLLTKTLATIEKLGYELNPEMPLVDYIKPYAKEIMLKNFALKKLASEGLFLLKDYIKVIQTLPGDVNEILTNVKNGKLIHDIQIGDQDKLFKALKNGGKLVSTSFLTGFMLVGSSILIACNKESALVDALFIVSSLNAFRLLIKSRSFKDTKSYS